MKLSTANQSSQRKLTSIIVPAKDEAKHISTLITKVEENLLGMPHEVIVVNDGSKDQTSQIANNRGAKVISHQRNLGKGAAMKAGAANAAGEVIVFIDGDGAHDPKDIPVVVAPILEGRADLVIGSRALPESRVSIAPFTRRISNNAASVIISLLISVVLPLTTLFKVKLKWTRITDCTSGFRAISKDAWRSLELSSNGFQIEAEMIYEATRKRLAIIEIPISCNWDSRISHLSVVRDGWSTLKLLGWRLFHDLRYWPPALKKDLSTRRVDQ